MEQEEKEVTAESNCHGLTRVVDVEWVVTKIFPSNRGIEKEKRKKIIKRW